MDDKNLVLIDGLLVHFTKPGWYLPFEMGDHVEWWYASSNAGIEGAEYFTRP